MKIVVIGGTGLIGSKVVEKLKLQGHEAVAAAPNTGVNTLTGEGLAEALTGASVVVDVSNSPSFDEKAAMDFFQTAGRNIAAAEVEAGVRHHVALSVVGTDRMQDSGYFRAKQAQEQLIKASPIPFTLVHATQFFEFMRTIADFSTIAEAVRLPPVQFNQWPPPMSRPRLPMLRWGSRRMRRLRSAGRRLSRSTRQSAKCSSSIMTGVL